MRLVCSWTEHFGQNVPRCDNNLSPFAARLEKRGREKYKNYVLNSILLNEPWRSGIWIILSTLLFDFYS